MFSIVSKLANLYKVLRTFHVIKFLILNVSILNTRCPLRFFLPRVVLPYFRSQYSVFSPTDSYYIKLDISHVLISCYIIKM